MKKVFFLGIFELVEIVLQFFKIISNIDAQVHVVLFCKNNYIS